MGATTQAGFYENKQGGKTIKPVELIKQRNKASKPLIQYLWFERAEKVIKQLDHLMMLSEFLDYAALISSRFHNEYIPLLKEKSASNVSKQRLTLAREMKGFLELYSTYQIEYNYFNHLNLERFTLFKETFESKTMELEN
eukprot:CAMPEP_0170546600 /NCGR_PEP_ID=MMETSP0211-20121228/4952_1 /TAXON_ID=311385 /ORGANISM="Pseudokeronopsis sp., Strain OXSARD2" /LENGTH=139 /DNA_ID=CAMNT_0010851151 /DNA_START=1278 /DNA_END=1697 /DNA_ORIENTATION=+